MNGSGVAEVLGATAGFEGGLIIGGDGHKIHGKRESTTTQRGPM